MVTIFSMILTMKIQIHPDTKAKEKLWDVSNRCTDLANACIEQRRDRNSWGKVNVFSQKKELPALKKACPDFKVPSSQVLQNVVFGVDRAYKMFFTKWKSGDKEVRPPKFRSRRYFFTQEYSQPKTCFDLSMQGELQLAYGKSPKDWISIAVPHFGFSLVKTAKVSQDSLTKKWYVCLTYSVPEKSIVSGHRLYFDPGCKTSLTGIKTTGEFFEYDFNALRQVNRSTYKLIDNLKSRKDKIKNRKQKSWRRLNKRIQSLFSKINTRTKTYLHTLANQILDDHPDVETIKVGDWDKRKTLADTGSVFANRAINRAVQNNNPLGKLIDILKYKAKLRGQEVEKFDERGSTRTCNHCDHIHRGGISPSKRQFVCKKCGFSYPRDHHSCLNFIKRSEPAVWHRLPKGFQGSRRRVELAPFSFKPQVATGQTAARAA